MGRLGPSAVYLTLGILTVLAGIMTRVREIRASGRTRAYSSL